MNTDNTSISKKPFTKHELLLLKGHYIHVAKKCNSSNMYVGQIANGERKANSKKASEILNVLTTLVKSLKEIYLK